MIAACAMHIWEPFLKLIDKSKYEGMYCIVNDLNSISEKILNLNLFYQEKDWEI